MMKKMITCVFLLFQVTLLSAQIEITLRRSFIDSLSKSATITSFFIVDEVKDKVNPPSKDGDIHMAGRNKVIGLPIVAEIMNAKKKKDIVKFMQNKESAGIADSLRTVKMAGAWRIWCEHSGNDEQIQGKPLSRITSTNPDHVFEIHPVTKINDSDLLSTLFRTRGYRFKKAEDAFRRYDATNCRLSQNANGMVTITTYGVGYNYVDFKIKLRSQLKQIIDGYYAQCDVYSLDDEIIGRNIRMIFIKGSEPCDKALALSAGSLMRVIGIPRISMGLIGWRLDNQNTRPQAVNWNLPYEMIIVGVVN